MNTPQAINIISALAKEGKLLETLMYMTDNLQQFSTREIMAYHVVMAEFKDMFAPVE